MLESPSYNTKIGRTPDAAGEGMECCIVLGTAGEMPGILDIYS